ncbi:MAG TPA: methionine--tRNA ligase [Candidatus Azoamicus sp. OHIO2]
MHKYIFISSALPYPNGNLHIGHMLEFIQTDIWIRFKNKNNLNAFYFSGIDAHGTPIMLKALSEKTIPQKLVTNFFLSYKKDLLNFNINYSNFYTTHSYENEILTRNFFYKLYEKNLIYIKKTSQFYDNKLKSFLPDRYIIGTCPKCKSVDQYGDICEKCNFNYDALELINPKSKITNTTPIILQTNHYFFSLEKFQSFLINWCKKTLLQKQMLNKLTEWFKIGLNPWNISRNSPYFGIKIPGEQDKFFYVWIDAPLGYFASIQNFFLKSNININHYLFKTKKFILYHFIGKDIISFHALFWIAILKAMNIKLPKDIIVHGFLTINGKKMSKSKNTFITAKDLNGKFNTDYIRFYLASKLNNKITDIDFNIKDFINKINSDLIGKFINILSRISTILIKNYNGILAEKIFSYDLFYEYTSINKTINSLYNKRKFNKIIKIIINYTDKINLYIEKEKPWYLHVDVLTYKRGHEVCTTALNLFFILLFYIKPIIPQIVSSIEVMLKLDKINNSILVLPYTSICIKNYKHIIYKLKNHD